MKLESASSRGGLDAPGISAGEQDEVPRPHARLPVEKLAGRGSASWTY
jgi:hypothetical protein